MNRWTLEASLWLELSRNGYSCIHVDCSIKVMKQLMICLHNPIFITVIIFKFPSNSILKLGNVIFVLIPFEILAVRFYCIYTTSGRIFFAWNMDSYGTLAFSFTFHLGRFSLKHNECLVFCKRLWYPFIEEKWG